MNSFFPLPHLYQDPAFCDTHSIHLPAFVTDPNEAQLLSGYKQRIHSLRGEEFLPQASLNDTDMSPWMKLRKITYKLNHTR